MIITWTQNGQSEECVVLNNKKIKSENKPIYIHKRKKVKVPWALLLFSFVDLLSCIVNFVLIYIYIYIQPVSLYIYIHKNKHK